jgi:methylmalonyl-CoA mutase cobalamin-binding domain/chain
MGIRLVEYVRELNVNSAMREVESMLVNDILPEEIQKQMLTGLIEVGKKYEAGEFFIGDLIVAGMLMKDVLSIEQMKQLGEPGDKHYNGKVLIGTVSTDIHDIGKDIFAQLLSSNGFEVINLGVDVLPEQFIEGIKEHSPDIVGISCILTTSISYVPKTIKAIQEAGLRDQVKIIVGGAAISKKYYKSGDADAVTDDAYEGLKISEQWMKV